MAWSEYEFIKKVAEIRSLMANTSFAATLISSQTDFFWLTGGRPYINVMQEKACADLLITGQAVYLIANNVETERLWNEEIGNLPIQKVTYNWWEADGLVNRLKEIIGDRPMASTAMLGQKFAELRRNLSIDEQKRFVKTGRAVGKVLEEVAFTISPGKSEHEIADMLRITAIRYGVNANVALVAVDDRAFKYRHPVPTGKKLDKYAMLVISGQKDGLYASATRLVHFGQPEQELRKRHKAVLQVDMAYITATVPGNTLKQIFNEGVTTYKEVGFAGEWVNHHQGGLAGYNSREVKADMFCAEVVRNGQAYAWNPTIDGVKSEDTFLVTEKGPLIITQSAGFPLIEVEHKDITLKRPDILIR